MGLSVTQALAACPLFTGLAATTLAGLARSARVEQIAAGKVVMRKGGPGDALYVIVAGRLVASVAIGDRLLMLSRIEAPEAVGEMAFDGGQRTADVVADSPATLIRIARRDLQAALRRDSTLAERAVGLLCKRLRQVSQDVEDAALRDLNGRLARRLLSLADDMGLVRPVTQQELGEMLGTRREVINRLLQGLRSKGLIETRKGRLRILGRNTLEQL